MERFIKRHQEQIVGVLSGFDRLLFRGSLRSISYVEGMNAFLATHRVLLKDFAVFARRLSTQLCQHAERLAARHARPMQYVASPSASKEQIVHQMLAKDDVQKGLICVLSCVEPCQSFDVRGERASGHIRLIPAPRKCTHLYFYYLDPEFGLMHVRLQTWLPFTIQVCINGRDYLARAMDRAGIHYERYDNCFTRIDDLPQAQSLLNRLDTRKWTGLLNALARRVNPWVTAASGLDLHGYYWSVRQGEYATDVMFKDVPSLQAIYPRLADHAIQQFSCRDVLRFLGRGQNGQFRGEVSANLAQRPEGLRIRHWVDENSIKMYDKQGRVLRIETTMNNPRRFKVRRPATRQGRRCKAWLPLRKGVADLPRRVEICRAANERYLEALAVVDQPSPIREVLDPVSRPVVREGRPYRALRPVTPEDAERFRVILQGQFAVQGFRNRDLRAAGATDRITTRQLSGRITRWLRLLRAHGLIRKVSHTRYYRMTAKGHHVMTTALKLRELDLTQRAA